MKLVKRGRNLEGYRKVFMNLVLNLVFTLEKRGNQVMNEIVLEISVLLNLSIIAKYGYLCNVIAYVSCISIST